MVSSACGGGREPLPGREPPRDGGTRSGGHFARRDVKLSSAAAPHRSTARSGVLRWAGRLVNVSSVGKAVPASASSPKVQRCRGRSPSPTPIHSRRRGPNPTRPNGQGSGRSRPSRQRNGSNAGGVVSTPALNRRPFRETMEKTRQVSSMKKKMIFSKFDAELNTDCCDPYNNAELTLTLRMGFRQVNPAGGA